MSRVVVAALLAAFASVTPAAAGTRDIPFTPVAAPSAGTCPVGDHGAFRVRVASSLSARTALAPCLGAAAPAGHLLLVAAPDEPQAGTRLRVVRVSVQGEGTNRRLRVTVRLVRPAAGAPAAQVVTTPRAVVRLARAVPRAFVLQDRAGRVLARGRA